MSAVEEKHWLYALVPDWIVARLLVPEGLLGWCSAQMMTRINRDTNRDLVSSLALCGDEEALEVGFGPGVAIGLLVAALPRGLVSGIDPSSLMVRLARRRNRAAIAVGRVDLRRGNVLDLPWPDEHFDVVCSANSVQIWDPLDRALSEIRRVLRRGGRLGVSVHTWAGQDLESTILDGLAGAGFDDVRVTRVKDRSGDVLHVLASCDAWA